MKLVIDANILFAALIKDNVTSEFIFDEKVSLYAPEFLFEEVEKYNLYIKSKTERNDFHRFLSIIKNRIKVVNCSEQKLCMEKAQELCPDPNDVPYFAVALKERCAIWSNDKRLKSQKEILIYSTEDLIGIKKKKS